MMMRAFVVVNPAAGGGRTERLWRSIRDRLSRLGLDFEFGETTGRGVATQMVRQAVAGRWPLVVVVGGDGTVNEAINGLLDVTGSPPGSLAVIGTGRGRDAARNLGLAPDPETAARRIVEGEDVLVDLGVAEWGEGRSRYFINAAGAGFDAVVAKRAQAGGGSGTVPYLLAVLRALRAHRSVPASIHLDDRPLWSGPMTAAVVANGAYYGGGMKIAPDADPADGCLDLVVLGNLGRLELLRWLPTVYRGAHLANPKVSTWRGRTILIATVTPVPVHVDGEAVAETPVRMSVCPQALRLRR
ncbi:MAG: diacylglycerol/lipid kinase family protein [Candidatus Methylomirabilia bacterium]